MASVYLLHWPAFYIYGGHYLSVSAKADPEVPMVIVRGTGVVQTPEGAIVSDVWEARDLAEARRLRARLAKQGGRRRICSICSPGNARGAGTGNWERKGRSR